jgi:hypothetical protein
MSSILVYLWFVTFKFNNMMQEYSLSPLAIASLTTPNALLRHMQSHSIQCIASGGQSPNFKFFFFAQKAEETSIYLVECIINTSSAKSQIKIKADSQHYSNQLCPNLVCPET